MPLVTDSFQTKCSRKDLSPNVGTGKPKRDTHQCTLASIKVTDVSLTDYLEKMVYIAKRCKRGDSIKKFGEVPNQPVVLTHAGGWTEWMIFSQILVDSFAF